MALDQDSVGTRRRRADPRPAHRARGSPRGPILPLDLLYAATGLEVRGREMAEPGLDWDALAVARRRYRLGVFYDLDEALASSLREPRE